MRWPSPGFAAAQLSRSFASLPLAHPHSKYASRGPWDRPRFTMRHNAAESSVPADDVNHTCGFARATNVGIIASRACSGRIIASSRTSRSAEKPRPDPEIVRALNFKR